MDDPLDHNQAEPGDISSALDVEQLDLNLYRSRSLSLPFQARGVFGGQVISQALVAATRCVKPEFTLHVRVRPHTALSALTCITHTRTVAACTYPSGNPSVIGEKKKLMLMMRFLRPISSLAPLLPRRCSTTSTECAMDDRTLRDPSAPSRAGASSSLCSVPSRSPRFGSRLVTGPCHALLIRTTVRAKLSTSRTWQHGRTFQRAAGRDSSLMQKCVILSRRSTPWVA